MDKRLATIILLIAYLPWLMGAIGISTVSSGSADDTTYNATTWNGSLLAPTQNSVRDKIETLQPLDSDLTTYAGITPSANVQTFLGAADYSAMRTQLGLVIGTNVQAYDADLTTYAGITPSANVQSLLGAADYSAMRTQLGLVIGTNVQAYDADLTTYAGITPAANVQSLLGAADYSAMRTQLSLVVGTNVQAYDAELAAIAGLTSAANKGIQFTGSGTASTIDMVAGTYTPSQVSTNTNVDSVTFRDTNYIRIGNIVHVSGEMDIDPTTGTTSTTVKFSLPVASNLGATGDLAGVGSDGTQFTVAASIPGCTADTTNDCAQLTWVCAGTASRTMKFTFTYEVI